MAQLDDNAIDDYTFNRTTCLIEFLQAFIKEQNSKQGGNPVSFAFSFYSTGHTHSKIIEKEINIALELKNLCEQLRSQIGSPETMPKGLVINLMVYLSDAIRSCQEMYSESNETKCKLLNCIKQEIANIQNLYPDLAQAGEELQKAIANYHFQKS